MRAPPPPPLPLPLRLLLPLPPPPLPAALRCLTVSLAACSYAPPPGHAARMGCPHAG